MEPNKLYLLLDVINRNGSVKKLTREGITFNEIAEQTNNAIFENLVSNKDDKIVLTAKGIELLGVLEKEHKRTNKNEWIEKDFKNKIPKLEKNMLFLPRQDELSF